jgi:signal transduction histidine kinase
MAPRGRSVRSLLLAWFLAPTLALFVLAGLVGARLSRGVLERELGDNLSALAAATAAQLNATRVLSIEAGDDQAQTRTWRNTQKTLTDVQRATAVRRLVVFDRDGRVRVDSAQQVPTGAELADLARDRLELARVLEHGERAASQVLFRGDDGRLYKTGYAPLLDEAGAVVGAVAVEARGEFWESLQDLSWAYALLTLGVLCALLGAALWMGASIANPLRRLVAAAQGIGQGDLQTPVPPQPTQEVGTLSAELEEMRQALCRRDSQLKMMLAGVAHEVRNPIGGIELFAGLLSEDLPPAPPLGGPDPFEDARAHVRRIQREIDYLKRVVEDFLGFARDQKLASARFDAALLAREATELLSAEAQDRQVTLRVQAEPAELHGDQSLLTAAAVNLVKNALQASPAGAEVQVRGRAVPQGYLLEVEDQGAGIAATEQERIFEPFFTTREKGTGLGLPLSRKIVQAHGGELTVRSLPGQTVFTLRLPRAESTPGRH